MVLHDALEAPSREVQGTKLLYLEVGEDGPKDLIRESHQWRLGGWTFYRGWNCECVDTDSIGISIQEN